ncbi:MAG: hypothetical protein HXX11_00235 [Desulfuromonadales bacterium]|nr:hypothetical protein [Desulfuromonadales bacterium]
MGPMTSTQSNMPDALMALIVSEARQLIQGKTEKSFIIYGSGARGIVFYEALRLLGYNAAYFVDKAAKEGMTICGLPVYEPLKIMYENYNDIFVAIAAQSPTELITTLEGLGLEPEKHFGIIFDASLNDGIHMPTANELDFFLGYGRSSEIPGFQLLSSKTSDACNCNQSIKIITLGGSTTDPDVMDLFEWNDDALQKSSHGSWPRHFQKILSNFGIDACIYNGGIIGYSSAQELLKLWRDGLSISPDVVIVLDGFNDGLSFLSHKNHPKHHSHFAAIENVINPLLSHKTQCSDYHGIETVYEQISYGIESSKSRWQEWHENHRIMSAFCKEFGIEYLAFIQPFGWHDCNYLASCDVVFRINSFLHNFFISAGQTIKDQLNNGSLNLVSLLQHFVSNAFSCETDQSKHFSIHNFELVNFFSQARTISKSSDFIIPIEDTFYGYPDIYCDTVHCTSKGNQLLADRIYRELANRGIWHKLALHS